MRRLESVGEVQHLPPSPCARDNGLNAFGLASAMTISPFSPRITSFPSAAINDPLPRPRWVHLTAPVSMSRHFSSDSSKPYALSPMTTELLKWLRMFVFSQRTDGLAPRTWSNAQPFP